jgi:hypothetical protein
MKKKILLLGLLPGVVDIARFPGLTVETLAAGLEAQAKSLCDLGFDAKWCLTDLGETAGAVVQDTLMASHPDVVLIGAALRMVPDYLLLFEKLVNLVHEHAPGAKICFNSRPDDTQEAVLRWIAPPSTSG